MGKVAPSPLQSQSAASVQLSIESERQTRDCPAGMLKVVSPETEIAVYSFGTAPSSRSPALFKQTQLSGSDATPRSPPPTHLAEAGTSGASEWYTKLLPSAERAADPPFTVAKAAVSTPSGVSIPPAAVKRTAPSSSVAPSEANEIAAPRSIARRPAIDTPAGSASVTFRFIDKSPKAAMFLNAASPYANERLACPSPRPQSSSSESTCGAASKVNTGFKATTVTTGLPNFPVPMK